MNKRNICAGLLRLQSVFLLMFVLLPFVCSQSELDVDFSTFGGAEYNVYKSPDILSDPGTGEPYDMDTILVSDFLFDLGYDIEYDFEMPEKSVFSIGSDLWYRHYLNYSQIDQKKLNVEVLYGRYLGEKTIIGGFYEFRWSDRIGSSVVGDLLQRSFKYFGNTGNLFLEYEPGNKTTFDLSGDYAYKYYYSENTRDPLHHANLAFNAGMEYSPSRKHDISLEAEFVDRTYFKYHALDSNGRYRQDYPLRHFRYYIASFDYDLKPTRGFLISPGFRIRRRIDMFQDYYSYWAYGGSLRIRYRGPKIYISLYSTLSQTEYDIRKAFTSQDEDPELIYFYYDFIFTFRYNITNNWEISLELESDNRDSNTDLEYFKTRRSYNNHVLSLGVIYSLPRMRW